jgi:hypothetical protein
MNYFNISYLAPIGGGAGEAGKARDGGKKESFADIQRGCQAYSVMVLAMRRARQMLTLSLQTAGFLAFLFAMLAPIWFFTP